MSNLHITSTYAPTIWCDNLNATYLSVNLIIHARTKHVKVDHHFIRDMVSKKEIQIHFISYRDQLVDVFIKSFPTVSFTAFWFKLQIDPPPSACKGILWNVYI